jgi:hypothetical protein
MLRTAGLPKATDVKVARGGPAFYFSLERSPWRAERRTSHALEWGESVVGPAAPRDDAAAGEGA